MIGQPAGLAIDSKGEYLYMCDTENNAIYKVNTRSGSLSVFVV